MAKVLQFTLNEATVAITGARYEVYAVELDEISLELTGRDLNIPVGGACEINVESAPTLSIGDEAMVKIDAYNGSNPNTFLNTAGITTVVDDGSDPVTPIHIIPDMVTYHQSDIATDTILSGSSVVQWGDLTGNGNHIAQPDTGKAFTTDATDINGNNVFDATTATVMQTASAIYDLPNADNTMFALVRLNTNTPKTDGYRVFGGAVGIGSRYGVLINRGASNLIEAVNSTGFNVGTAPDVVFNGVTLIGLRRTGTNLTVFINGMSVDMGEVAVDVTPDYLSLCNTSGTSSGTIDGSYVFVGALRRAATDAEMLELSQWAQKRYGGYNAQPNITWDGDSRTVGVGSDPATPIPDRVALLLTQTPVYNNLAVAGQETTASVTKFQTQVPATYNAMYENNIYVINGFGINDVRLDRTTAAIIANLTTIAERAGQLGFDVVIATIPPRQTSTPEQEVVRTEVNAWIMSTDLDAIVLKVDINDDDRIGIWNDTYYDDPSHLNYAGQDIWAGLMADAINTLI